MGQSPHTAGTHWVRGSTDPMAEGTGMFQLSEKLLALKTTMLCTKLSPGDKWLGKEFLFPHLWLKFLVLPWSADSPQESYCLFSPVLPEAGGNKVITDLFNRSRSWRLSTEIEALGLKSKGPFIYRPFISLTLHTKSPRASPIEGSFYSWY